VRDPATRLAMLLAKEEYRESLEDLARSRLLDPKGNIGSDVLLMAMLNAAWPEKYKKHEEKRNEAAREALDTMKQMQRDWKRNLEAEAIEGEIVGGQG